MRWLSYPAKPSLVAGSRVLVLFFLRVGYAAMGVWRVLFLPQE